MAKILKRVDKEGDLEAQQPLKAALGTVLIALTPGEELDVEVIEVPLVRKRRLVKGGDVAHPWGWGEERGKLLGYSEEANASALHAADGWCWGPPGQWACGGYPGECGKTRCRRANISAGGPIPSILNHHLGSNIQHILEDIDMELDESVGMADDNMGPSTNTAVKTSWKLLSPILEAGTTSRAVTPKGLRVWLLLESMRHQGQKGLKLSRLLSPRALRA